MSQRIAKGVLGKAILSVGIPGRIPSVGDPKDGLSVDVILFLTLKSR